MKPMLAGFRAHLALPYQTTALCWLTVRRDGTVLAVTEHDRDIPFNLAAALTAIGLTPYDWIATAGTQTFLAESGFTSSDFASGSDLSVDTGEGQGVLLSPGMTVADIRARLWDYSNVCIFVVCWSDLSLGCYVERVGSLGEVTTGLGFFKAEWRGILQHYQNMIGQLALPMCNAVFGDNRCKKDLTALTVTGTLTGAATDYITLYDTGRTEPGPTGSHNIISISHANPGIVTMDSSVGMSNGMPVALSGIVGPSELNTTTFIRSLGSNQWSLGIDTTTMPAYISGGTVTPLGSGTGYFTFGRLRFTTGPNASTRWNDIKEYVPGQFALQLPLAYQPLADHQYEAIAGCDWSQATCRDRHNNIVNARALYFMPGINKLIQAGRRT